MTPTDDELLATGLEKIDDALACIMEMKSEGSLALAHFLHAVLTFGEQLASTSVDVQ